MNVSHPVRTPFLHQIYSGLLAFLMAFTSFGFIPESGVYETFNEASKISLSSFNEAATHIANDRHSTPIEGQDDLRAEEDDETEEEEMLVSSDLSPIPLHQFQLDLSKNTEWRSTTFVQYVGKKLALYIRYHCWKLDLNA